MEKNANLQQCIGIYNNIMYMEGSVDAMGQRFLGQDDLIS